MYIFFHFAPVPPYHPCHLRARLHIRSQPPTIPADQFPAHVHDKVAAIALFWPGVVLPFGRVGANTLGNAYSEREIRASRLI